MSQPTKNIYADYSEELKRLELGISMPTRTPAHVSMAVCPSMMSANAKFANFETGYDTITGGLIKYNLADNNTNTLSAGYNAGLPNSWGGFVEIGARKGYRGEEQSLGAIVSTSGQSVFNYRGGGVDLSMGSDFNIGTRGFGLSIGRDDRIGFQFSYSM